jgi:pyridoxine 5'-phosphate synthase PdxJ
MLFIAINKQGDLLTPSQSGGVVIDCPFCGGAVFVTSNGSAFTHRKQIQCEPSIRQQFALLLKFTTPNKITLNLPSCTVESGEAVIQSDVYPQRVFITPSKPITLTGHTHTFSYDSVHENNSIQIIKTSYASKPLFIAINHDELEVLKLDFANEIEIYTSSIIELSPTDETWTLRPPFTLQRIIDTMQIYWHRHEPLMLAAQKALAENVEIIQKNARAEEDALLELERAGVISIKQITH